MANIFITGISGCVGHYLFDRLAKNPDYHLFFLVRNPEKLKFDYQAYPNITIIKDSLRKIEKYSDILKEMDYLIHLAAGWGGSEVNYEYTSALFNFLDPDRCQKIIYFSTASILDSNNQPLESLDKIGTPYIRGKYLFYKKLPELKMYPRTTTLFLTWILGGNSRHPFSHAAQGIKKSLKWLWLLRFLKVDLNFHYIHAQDVALITEYFLKNEIKEKSLVLGNPAISVSQFIEELCRYSNQKIPFKVNLSLPFIRKAAGLLGKRLSDWDKFCLERTDFMHNVVDTSTFGINSNHRTVQEALMDLMPSHE
jgi:nucleoside-diphosphate-sugar epimerase